MSAMLLTVEKILVLQSVMMFSAVPEEYLIELAGRGATARVLRSGSPIFSKCVFDPPLRKIARSGRVRR